MLPELIYREERTDDYSLLVLLGFVSGLLGFGFARTVFPSNIGLLTVVFASIPLVYPLTRFFLEGEDENRPHLPEIMVYGSLFFGLVSSFLLLGYLFPESFGTQISQFEAQLMDFGITGYFFEDSLFSKVLSNNLFVFGAILVISVLIASAGAFVLTWNASVLGVFMAVLIHELPKDSSLVMGEGDIYSPVAYIPHATFEMGGFIIAGIAGSLISASVYRGHFDRGTWEDLAWLVLLGLGFVFAGAALETGRLTVLLVSLAVSTVAGYKSLA